MYVISYAAHRYNTKYIKQSGSSVLAADMVFPKEMQDLLVHSLLKVLTNMKFCDKDAILFKFIQLCLL